MAAMRMTSHWVSDNPRRGEAERQTVGTLDEGHGRIEKRRITATAALNGCSQDWPKLAQVVRVERERRVKGISTVEVSYFITSPTRNRVPHFYNGLPAPAHRAGCGTTAEASLKLVNL